MLVPATHFLNRLVQHNQLPSSLQNVHCVPPAPIVLIKTKTTEASPKVQSSADTVCLDERASALCRRPRASRSARQRNDSFLRHTREWLWSTGSEIALFNDLEPVLVCQATSLITLEAFGIRFFKNPVTVRSFEKEGLRCALSIE